MKLPVCKIYSIIADPSLDHPVHNHRTWSLLVGHLQVVAFEDPAGRNPLHPAGRDIPYLDRCID